MAATDPNDEVPAPIRDINAWVDSLRQTIVCEPHRETTIREAIEDLPGIYKVQPSEFCPPGQILVLPRRGELPDYDPPLETRRSRTPDDLFGSSGPPSPAS